MKKQLLIILLTIIAGICRAQDKASTNVLVTDFDENPIAGAQIQFFDTKNETTLKGVTDQDGKFIIELPAGLYNIRLKSVGKSKDYTAIEIPKLGPREVYNDVNIIIQYAEETSFTLTNLHFETGKATIHKGSFVELDELVEYLKLKSNLKIEIGGHTDNKGSDQNNLILSQNRAEAVRNYLLKKGIKASRIKAKGYGETKPIADNQTEAGRALNRRTEINILD